MNNKFVYKQFAARCFVCVVLVMSQCLCAMQEHSQRDSAYLAVAQSEDRCVEIDIDPTILQTYVGKYINTSIYLVVGTGFDDNIFTVSIQNGNELYIQSSVLTRRRLRPQSQTKFVCESDGAEEAMTVTFVVDRESKLILQQGGNGLVAGGQCRDR